MSERAVMTFLLEEEHSPRVCTICRQALCGGWKRFVGSTKGKHLKPFGGRNLDRNVKSQEKIGGRNFERYANIQEL